MIKRFWYRLKLFLFADYYKLQAEIASLKIEREYWKNETRTTEHRNVVGKNQRP